MNIDVLHTIVGCVGLCIMFLAFPAYIKNYEHIKDKPGKCAFLHVAVLGGAEVAAMCTILILT